MALIVIDSDLIGPSIARLESLCRARTKDSWNNEGSFTDKTRPTTDQANDLIDLARQVVAAELGDTIPDKFTALVETVVLYRAAMELEVSYYPEQAADGKSAYSLYERQYLALLAAVRSRLAGSSSDTPGSDSFYSLPVVGRDGYLKSDAAPWLI